jgi:hypothetical protein
MFLFAVDLTYQGRIHESAQKLWFELIRIHVGEEQPDGRILVGGRFYAVDGVSRKGIARLNPDGSLDLAFNPGASSTVYSLVLLPSGKILVVIDDQDSWHSAIHSLSLASSIYLFICDMDTDASSAYARSLALGS